MQSHLQSFAIDHAGSELRYGRGCVADVGDLTATEDSNRALVVCGSNVGANEAVIGPLVEALDDRLAGVFDETTPDKRAETAFDGIERMRALDADLLIGVGGGSSLDLARQMSAFDADGRTLTALRDQARSGQIDPVTAERFPTPVVAVPTTFAGAGVSNGGSIEVFSASASPTGEPIRASGSVTPEAVFFDPALFETTPNGALTRSAMNGFDKGIETVYSTDPTAISDATATKGLQLLVDALPRLSADDPSAVDRAVTGLILVQYDRTTSIVHAFGHGFSRRYSLQQGIVHAVVVPHVLRYLFEQVDARRTVLAEGLDVPVDGRSSAEVGAGVVTAVSDVRDALELPDRLRDVDGVCREDLRAIAEAIVEDEPMERTPSALDSTPAEIESVLQAAW